MRNDAHDPTQPEYYDPELESDEKLLSRSRPLTEEDDGYITIYPDVHTNPSDPLYSRYFNGGR